MIDKFKTIKINVKGKNIERFVYRLIENNIELLEINKINYKEIELKIYKKDYKKIQKIKTIYKIKIIEVYGLLKIKQIFEKNKIFIGSLIMGIILLIILSNFIFKVEVIHTNSELRNLVLQSLSEYGIEKFHLKKDYDELNEIKKKILTKYSDKIEWLEINEYGTKYEIRLEERKINKIKEKNNYQNIIAKKSAIIKSISADKGEIIKQVNDYVNKGDVVISGSIYLNDEIKDIVRAEGQIYGEVWYKTIVEYPLYYRENKYTNNKKNIFVIKFLNKNIELSFDHFLNKEIQEKEIVSNQLLPIKLVYQNQQEIVKIKKDYTQPEAIKKANEIAKEKIESKLNDKEYIISQKNLKINTKGSKIIVESFFAVNENITDYEEIGE